MPSLASLTVILVAMLVFWAIFNTSTPASPALCPADFTDATDAAGITDAAGTDGSSSAPTITMDELVACSFSVSYWEARAKFVRAAETASATTHSLPVMNSSLYTIDIAVLPGSGPGVAVISSGVHGVEGFAGSAIQIAMLRKVASEKAKKKYSPTLVFVHAVNPYGMAHFRRFNENNVDLNRNALHPSERVAADSRDRNIAGYEDFSEGLFNPPHAPTFFDAYVGFIFKAVCALLQHGAVTLKKAVVTSQYHDPKGIFFGGLELQPSHRLLSQFLVKHFQHITGPVTWLDVHTGLGPSGHDSLLFADADHDAESMEKLFPGSLAGVQCPFTGQGGDVAAGYELTKGFVNGFYSKFFSRSKDVLMVTQEFGTLSASLVLRSMILENQAFNYDKSQQPFWATFVRDAFYVQTDQWKQSILERGLAVFSQVIARSSN